MPIEACKAIAEEEKKLRSGGRAKKKREMGVNIYNGVEIQELLRE